MHTRPISRALLATTLLTAMLLPARGLHADELPQGHPVPSGERSPPMRTVAKVNIVIGGSLIIGGIFTALAGLLKKKSIDDACPNKVCPADRAADLSTLRGYENVTNALWLSGAIVLGSGIGLYLYGEDPKTQASGEGNNGEGNKGEGHNTSLRLAPAPGGVTAVGTF